MRQLFYPLLIALLIHAGSCDSEAQAQAGSCPAIVVEGTPEPVCPGTPLTFTARVSGHSSTAKLAYQWSLSAGTIESGQGTDTIVVAPVEAGRSVKATVKVTGINAGCVDTASQEAQTFACCLPRMFDQYGNIPFEDEKARLDNFAIQILNEPDARGYLIAYGGRITYPGEAVKRADRAKAYITGRSNFMDDRVTTIDGGYREDATVELWILPATVSPPTPSPTLRPEDVLVQVIEQPLRGRPARRRKR